MKTRYAITSRLDTDAGRRPHPLFDPAFTVR